ncbi:exonuclease SbcCD subunit D [Actinocorallia sp. API 0066]|uniref:exonuclease SbcCD subunit D n=1 Tax=Actinocorallia sp. API 0066 TaxID=2896846 RepID=UPI001E657547|nr:exonuclease SbcCD subunit D [Actinocorallia sp. API 0066]MCD0448598.1 exonuclease SbcCD subunit D [Actinocorallia sp. API 0066]
MRFLHTSDWHLGRAFHRESLLSAQAAFADHLVATVAARRVECVLVSGDVYDRAIPPLDAVELYDETLARLRAAGTRVVLISGNHDSAIRLGVGSRLFEEAGVHVRTDPAGVGRPVHVGEVAVYPVPYLEPELVRASWELPERSHPAALTEALRRIHADGHRGPRVVLAHAFVSAGETPVVSESERDISVGGASIVPAGVFDGIDYVALGHLHGRRALREHVRYSGSPLAYSFSEMSHVKGSWLVDVDASGLRGAEFVEAPVPRRLAHLTGTLDELLTRPEHTKHEDHWVKATLTDARRVPAAMERLRERFPHALVLEFAAEAFTSDGPARAALLATRTEPELADAFLEEVMGEPPTEEESTLLRSAFEHCRLEEGPRVPAQRSAARTGTPKEAAET